MIDYKTLPKEILVNKLLDAEKRIRLLETLFDILLEEVKPNEVNLNKLREITND